MAFEWNDAQGRWLSRRLAARARRFETNVEVAGSALAIDAAAQDAGPDEFFDFLSPIAIFENKAPSETLDEQELLLVSARALLLVRKWRLGLSGLEETTLVILCARMSRRLRARLEASPLRPGILETRLQARVVIVEADRLGDEPRDLPVLLRYARDARVRKVVDRIVDEDRREHYPILWLLRQKLFEEVLEMKGRPKPSNVIDLASSVRSIGIKQIVDSVGLAEVIDEVGIDALFDEIGVEALIEKVGVDTLIDKVGVDTLIDKVGVDTLIDKVGVDAIIESIGVEPLLQKLQRMQRRRKKRS